MGQLTKRIYDLREEILNSIPSYQFISRHESNVYSLYELKQMKSILKECPLVKIKVDDCVFKEKLVVGWTSNERKFICMDSQGMHYYETQQGSFTIEVVIKLYELIIEYQKENS